MTEKQEFIESLKTNENNAPRVYKDPTAEIDYENYLPRKWGVDYVQLTDEADELEHVI